MRLPCRERTQFLDIFHVIEKRQHLAELVHGIGWNAFRVIFCVEPLQALMDEVPYFHLAECSLLLNTCQAGSLYLSKYSIVVLPRNDPKNSKLADKSKAYLCNRWDS